MVCLGNMCMATLNKGDNDSHNNTIKSYGQDCVQHYYTVLQGYILDIKKTLVNMGIATKLWKVV